MLLSVQTSEDGAQTLSVSQSNLTTAVSAVVGFGSIGAATTAGITAAITSVATQRAQNGAEGSRLGFAAELLTSNRTNLEAANSRIVDVDVASESTKLARNNILVQASSAMLAQANASSQSVLTLLR